MAKFDPATISTCAAMTVLAMFPWSQEWSLSSPGSIVMLNKTSSIACFPFYVQIINMYHVATLTNNAMCL